MAKKSKTTEASMEIYKYKRKNGLECIQLCAITQITGLDRALINDEQRIKFINDAANSRFKLDYGKFGIDTRDTELFNYWNEIIKNNSKQ